MANIEKKLRLLRVVIGTLIVLIISSHVWLWAWPETFALVSSGNPIVANHGGMDRLSLLQRLGGFSVTLLPNLVLILVLWNLHRLTHLLSAGHWFDQPCEMIFRKVGKLLFWYIGLNIMQRTLLVLVLTATNPPGEKQFAVQFSSNDVAMLMPALLALIISHMIHLARAQQEELKEIV